MLNSQNKQRNEMLKDVFGDVLSRVHVFECHKRFTDGREEIAHDERLLIATTVGPEELQTQTSSSVE